MAGLCAWCSGMSVYQKAAKEVGPKMLALKAAEKAKAAADKSLAQAMGELAEIQAELDNMIQASREANQDFDFQKVMAGARSISPVLWDWRTRRPGRLLC